MNNIETDILSLFINLDTSLRLALRLNLKTIGIDNLSIDFRSVLLFRLYGGIRSSLVDSIKDITETGIMENSV